MVADWWLIGEPAVGALRTMGMLIGTAHARRVQRRVRQPCFDATRRRGRAHTQQSHAALGRSVEDVVKSSSRDVHEKSQVE